MNDKSLQDHDLVMAKFFIPKKCKPWDMKKRRRYSCCHNRIEEGHARFCLAGIKKINVPELESISNDLFYE